MNEYVAKGTNLFLVFEGSSIGLLDEDSRSVDSLLFSYFRVLLVLGHHLDLGCSGPPFDGDWDSRQGSQYLSG